MYKYQVVQPLKGTHGIGIYSKFKIANPFYLKNKNNKPFAPIADL